MMSEYTLRNLKIGNTQQMSDLASASGELYSRTVDRREQTLFIESIRDVSISQ